MVVASENAFFLTILFFEDVREKQKEGHFATTSS